MAIRQIDRPVLRAIADEQVTSEPSVAKRPSRRVRALAVGIDLNQPGRLRAGHLITLLAISHTALYKRIADGRVPPPDGYDGVRPFWTTRTVRNFLEPWPIAEIAERKLLRPVDRPTIAEVDEHDNQCTSLQTRVRRNL